MIIVFSQRTVLLLFKVWVGAIAKRNRLGKLKIALITAAQAANDSTKTR
ncbi:MAG: hypothetical protein AB1589_26225 [Cyanobacteriota bacterium]